MTKILRGCCVSFVVSVWLAFYLFLALKFILRTKLPPQYFGKKLSHQNLKCVIISYPKKPNKLTLMFYFRPFNN